MTTSPTGRTEFRLEGRRIYVAGHRGLVGQALLRRLAVRDCTVLTAERAELDLRRQRAVEAWFASHRPEVVILAAATVGGIQANRSRPAEFLYDNLAIGANVIEAARRSGVARLLCLGSSCIYPRDAPQPMSEDTLLKGALEPTNEWYAVAKIAAVKLCQAYRRQHGCDFIAAMPTNLYGPGDRFDPEQSHVVPALLRRLHEAKAAGAPTATVWGSGRPRREFLHVDDCAEALIHLLQVYAGEAPVNVGTGRDITIAELARLIAEVVGYDGALRFDPTMPDGTPRKLLDVSRLRALGWTPRISLREGLAETYAWYLRQPGLVADRAD